ncbi:MAG TPA: cytochrome c-type biogenesis protein [Geminicoccus sp.]|uniref:cytochrome c-type biogenesis protein n=1 Tax=Geminicoccus sp. TaxID=2024832 RepID=UPI002BBC6B33|nr:cytochrome c-type biogenesis protein [Geminicoccus sp.]HWL70523.1 cytochrome c-type biogenesis protein [Geminicoccus sp.]
MTRWIATALLVCLLALAPGGGTPLLAVTPDEQMADPAQEARARELGRELRCLVCQNQSIDDSDADLARDLRRIVRERIAAGDDDQAILAYLTDRYGEFVLLRPPVTAATWLLWFGPPLLLLAAGATAFLWRRRSVVEQEPGLSPEEERRLDRMLAESGPDAPLSGPGGRPSAG